MKYGLIQLAGRQLLPNLWAGLTLQRAGHLVRHVILHTDEQQESALPAEQLMQLLWNDDLVSDEAAGQVKHLLQEVAATAADTLATAKALIEEVEADAEAPSVDAWLLHATGGNKMMCLGIAQLAGHPRVAGIIYRDISGTWLTLHRQPDGTIADSPLMQQTTTPSWLFSLFQQPASLDTIPIERLLEAQFGDPGAFGKLRGNRPLDHVGLVKWLKLASEPSGGFSDYRLPASAFRGNGYSDGGAFEAFLAHLLKAAGVSQILWNVEGYGQVRSCVGDFASQLCGDGCFVFYDTQEFRRVFSFLE